MDIKDIEKIKIRLDEEEKQKLEKLLTEFTKDWSGLYEAIERHKKNWNQPKHTLIIKLRKLKGIFDKFTDIPGFEDLTLHMIATLEQVIENIKDAVRLHIEDRLEVGEQITLSESVSLTSLEVAV